MTSNNCLNCGSPLTGKFCAECGQKADIHRITFKHLISHDLLHGLFHIEKGILFTVKEALTRPGKAALDYITGKRKRYYNVFYLILITIALMLFTRQFAGSLLNDGLTNDVVETKEYMNEASKKIDQILAQKNKIIIFLFVPFAAFNSFVLFKRKKLFISEHAIIAGMILLGMLLISTCANILFWLKPIQDIGTVVSMLSIALIISYICFGYYNTFSEDYTKLEIAMRILFFLILICLELFAFMFLLIGFATNWEFGNVEISI